MPNPSKADQSERILICAPFGRDASLIAQQLVGAGLKADVCPTVEELSAAMQDGAGVALISDEALRTNSVESLRSQLAKQPTWSDFPLVVLTSGGDTTTDSRYRLRLLEPLGNVSLLERPLRAATLVSSINSALRQRRRQYQLAAYFEERNENERQIMRQNEALRKANGELEEFAFAASHDLQEPLRMINIYSELLVRQFAQESEKARKYARFIEQGVSRMEKLLSDLLNYSRVIHSEAPKAETADLAKSLTYAMTTLSGRIEENQATIQTSELPVVPGDEQQIAQIFQNLISNALKYRRAEVSPAISINSKKTGDEWLITVADNGIGFEQHYAQHIFGLFKRLHKDEYPGTGLGLAICQRIMQRCGGRMWAEGRPGEGSTFYLAFPVTD